MAAAIELQDDTGNNDIDNMCVRETADERFGSQAMYPVVVCFGEMLLRLTAPGRQLLFQSPVLEACAGGAEANVAVSLARFGHSTSVVTVLPDNALGRFCIAELQRHGVRTDAIRFGPGRLGLYFLTHGVLQRPSEIIYDREGSAFARADADLVDWDAALSGAGWLHLSGITPALGPQAAQAALRAVQVASRLGVCVSFDCNYRAKLWESWPSDPARTLGELLGYADLAFADGRALALILGQQHESESSPAERFLQAAKEAFARYPRLQRIATTVRIEHSVDDHELSAWLVTRERSCSTRTWSLRSIVDRIGTGDAFAAGVLHGILSGLDDRTTIEFAAAAACLKHSIPGDFNLVSVADVEHLMRGGGFAVRR